MRISYEVVLKKALAPLRKEFDYIIIDCPPSLGLITTNALNASDSVLIPVQCEYYALEGLSQLMSSVQAVKRRYNDRLELEGVLLTMYDGRLNLTQQVVTEIKKYFPRKVFATVIPRTVRLSEAPSYGQPILYYDKSNEDNRDTSLPINKNRTVPNSNSIYYYTYQTSHHLYS